MQLASSLLFAHCQHNSRLRWLGKVCECILDTCIVPQMAYKIPLQYLDLTINHLWYVTFQESFCYWNKFDKLKLGGRIQPGLSSSLRKLHCINLWHLHCMEIYCTTCMEVHVLTCMEVHVLTCIQARLLLLAQQWEQLTRLWDFVSCSTPPCTWTYTGPLHTSH